MEQKHLSYNQCRVCIIARGGQSCVAGPKNHGWANAHLDTQDLVRRMHFLVGDDGMGVCHPNFCCRYTFSFFFFCEKQTQTLTMSTNPQPLTLTLVGVCLPMMRSRSLFVSPIGTLSLSLLNTAARRVFVYIGSTAKLPMQKEQKRDRLGRSRSWRIPDVCFYIQCILVWQSPTLFVWKPGNMLYETLLFK